MASPIFLDESIALPPRLSVQDLQNSQHSRTSTYPEKQKKKAPSFSTVSVGTDLTTAAAGTEFQMMNVTISILGLVNGIIMETNPKLASKIASNKRKVTSDVPVIAVVSASKNLSTTSRKTAVATHLPSLALGDPSFSNGRLHTFTALWPSDFDPIGDRLSTFEFKRLMKTESISSAAASAARPGGAFTGTASVNGSDAISVCSGMYQPEAITMHIHLMRGSEMITIGAVTAYITGSEVQDVQANLPVKVTRRDVVQPCTTRSKRGGGPMPRCEVKTKKSLKKGRKMLKPIAFVGDPSRKYRLDENALLRVLIKTSAKKEEVKRCNSIIAACGTDGSPVSGITQPSIAHHHRGDKRGSHCFIEELSISESLSYKSQEHFHSHYLGNPSIPQIISSKSGKSITSHRHSQSRNGSATFELNNSTKHKKESVCSDDKIFNCVKEPLHDEALVVRDVIDSTIKMKVSDKAYPEFTDDTKDESRLPSVTTVRLCGGQPTIRNQPEESSQTANGPPPLPLVPPHVTFRRSPYGSTNKFKPIEGVRSPSMEINAIFDQLESDGHDDGTTTENNTSGDEHLALYEDKFIRYDQSPSYSNDDQSSYASDSSRSVESFQSSEGSDSSDSQEEATPYRSRTCSNRFEW